MAWIYVDDQFPDHPKVVAAGGDAGWLWLCGMAYVKRYGTEGAIPKAQVPKLSDRKAPAKLARRLVEAGLWTEDGDVYRVHDYAEWNRPGEARKAAARKAAQARWRGHGRTANGSANAYADALPDDYEPPYEDDAEADAEADASTCPLPLPPVVTFSDTPPPLSGDASSEEDAKPPAQLPPVPPAVTDAIDVLARRDLDIRQAKPDLERVTNPASWLATARTNRRVSDGERLAELAALDPDTTPQQLVDALEQPDEPSPWLTADGTAAAFRRRTETETADLRAIVAEPPDPHRTERVAGLRANLRPEPSP